MKTSVASDVVIKEKGEVLLLKRNTLPYKNYWVLPGGFVKYREETDETAKREVKEETGLEVEITKLIGVYSDPFRDPRGHIISIAYKGKIKGGNLEKNEESKEIKFFSLDNLPAKIGFDHRKIIKDSS